MLVRVATAAVGIPIVLAVNYVGGWAFGASVALAAAVGAAEFCGMMRAGGYNPLTLLAAGTAAVAAALPLAVASPQVAWIGIIYALLLLGGALYLAPFLFRVSLLGWALTLMSVAYVGILLGHLALLRHLHHGSWWVLAVLLMTWAYDTGAYLTGRSLGRRPFMAHISPNKTLEGVAGGLVLAGVAGLVLVPAVGVPAYVALPLGAATGAVAQIGDLIESMCKRQVDVKDSGSVIPGHGGLLDRIDSLLVTGPLIYYAAVILGYAS